MLSKFKKLNDFYDGLYVINELKRDRIDAN